MRRKRLNRKLILILSVCFFCMGCSNQDSHNPELMLGRWKSSFGRADLAIVKDSLGYYAIVYHRLPNDKLCPVRYPIKHSHNSVYIQAEGRVLLTFSIQNKTLFLSPGGEYTPLIPK